LSDNTTAFQYITRLDPSHFGTENKHRILGQRTSIAFWDKERHQRGTLTATQLSNIESSQGSTKDYYCVKI